MAAGKTLKQHIQEKLAAAGITEATSAHVTFVNGETVIVVSADNPALARPMADVAKVELKRSAEAGFTLAQL